MVREYTNKIHDAIEQGILTGEQIADMALAFMSEDDVKQMCLANDLFVAEEEEEEEEEDDSDEAYHAALDAHLADFIAGEPEYEEEDTFQFHVIGDFGQESETELYSSQDYSAALHFVTGYIKDGTYGGYDTIELGYYLDNGEWLGMDLYSPEGDDHI